MRRTRRTAPAIALGAILIVVAACGGASASPAGPSPAGSPSPSPASSVAVTASPAASAGEASSQAGGAASASTGGSTAANDQCAKFTTDQVNTLTGGDPFQTAEPVMMDVPGCQWYFQSGAGNVNLQLLPGDQFGDWSGKAGVAPVSGVGDSAFVGPFPLGGTMAGAKVGGSFYFLTVSPAPSNDVVVAFLKQAMAQLVAK